MKRLSYIAILIVFIATLFFSNDSTARAFTATDQVQVNLSVEGCNNNSICEAGIGENTLSCPNDCTVVITPPGGNTTGSVATPFIYNLTVESFTDHAVLRFKTRSPVFAIVRWGTTSEYNTGVSRSTVFVTDHTVTMNNLSSATKYFFVIEGADGIGRTVVTHVGTFVTLALPYKDILANPTNVRTAITRQGITLRWDNPTSTEFDYVRVVRNTDRFRSSPFTGELIYEGTTEHVLDKNVELKKKYFYTLFSRGISGEFSSGVGINATYNLLDDAPVTLPPPPVASEAGLSYFLILQNGEAISTVGGIDEVNNKNTIYLESTPGTFPGFQDLWVELTDPSKRSIAYIFAFDADNNLHRTSIPPLSDKGDYEVRIYGFNKDHTVLLESGILRVSGGIISNNNSFEASDFYELSLSFMILWSLCFLVFLLWLKKRYNL